MFYFNIAEFCHAHFLKAQASLGLTMSVTQSEVLSHGFDISSLLEIFIFNLNFRSGDRLKYFVEVFCFSFDISSPQFNC